MQIDESGQLFFVDRLKDVFKNRGLQVAPSEVSSLIRRALPDIVSDCVVIGMPAPKERAKVGDEAWAFVILTPAAAAKVKKGGIRREEEERIKRRVKDVVKGNLAKHKWVEEVRFRKGDWPRGATNKILTRQIKTDALKELESGRTSVSAKL